MTHVWAVILGVVQGLAEFLPISSTAHLKLVPWLFEVRRPDPCSQPGVRHRAACRQSGRDHRRPVARLGRPVRRCARRSRRPPEHGGACRRTRCASTPFARKFIGFLLLTSIPGRACSAWRFDTKLEFLSTPDDRGPASVSSRAFRYAPLLLGVCMIVFGIALVGGRPLRRNAASRSRSMTWWEALADRFRAGGGAHPWRLALRRHDDGRPAARTRARGRCAVLVHGCRARSSAGPSIFGLKDVPISQLLSVDWVLGFIAAAVTSVLVMRWMLGYVKTPLFRGLHVVPHRDRDSS